MLHPQLFQDVLHVFFHGTRRNAQNPADSSVWLPRCNMLQHFPFAGGEAHRKRHGREPGRSRPRAEVRRLIRNMVDKQCDPEDRSIAGVATAAAVAARNRIFRISTGFTGRPPGCRSPEPEAPLLPYGLRGIRHPLVDEPSGNFQQRRRASGRVNLRQCLRKAMQQPGRQMLCRKLKAGGSCGHSEEKSGPEWSVAQPASPKELRVQCPRTLMPVSGKSYQMYLMNTTTR